MHTTGSIEPVPPPSCQPGQNQAHPGQVQGTCDPPNTSESQGAAGLHSLDAQQQLEQIHVNVQNHPEPAPEPAPTPLEVAVEEARQREAAKEDLTFSDHVRLAVDILVIVPLLLIFMVLTFCHWDPPNDLAHFPCFLILHRISGNKKLSEEYLAEYRKKHPLVKRKRTQGGGSNGGGSYYGQEDTGGNDGGGAGGGVCVCVCVFVCLCMYRDLGLWGWI
jgi:hypothetical protein